MPKKRTLEERVERLEAFTSSLRNRMFDEDEDRMQMLVGTMLVTYDLLFLLEVAGVLPRKVAAKRFREMLDHLEAKQPNRPISLPFLALVHYLEHGLGPDPTDGNVLPFQSRRSRRKPRRTRE